MYKTNSEDLDARLHKMVLGFAIRILPSESFCQPAAHLSWCLFAISFLVVLMYVVVTAVYTEALLI